MTTEKHCYEYSGPVMSFDRVVQPVWTSRTVAPTLRKAISNFKFQWKVKNGFMPNIKIDLPGKCKKVW